MERVLTHTERLNAIKRLGLAIDAALDDSNSSNATLVKSGIEAACASNPWFIREFVHHSLRAISSMLSELEESELISRYPSISNTNKKSTKVALMMAGNLPAVGFHDLLCLWLTGHKGLVRLSADDAKLLPALQKKLEEIEPRFKGSVEFSLELIKGFDAVIATGSNNTARYYHYYFGKWPSIIRSNRNSLAIITGSETEEQLKGLADDICLYFGMGCRSVSKLYLPEGYDIQPLLNIIKSSYGYLSDHSKFRNNFEYQSSVFLINSIPYSEAGCVLFKEDTALSSPISVVHYEPYINLDDVKQTIDLERDKIQCLVSIVDEIVDVVQPGHTQSPGFYDFADGVDVMEFLLRL